jgi:hypothetical protein
LAGKIPLEALAGKMQDFKLSLDDIKAARQERKEQNQRKCCG